MSIVDRATILSFHETRIRDFGAGTTGALGWKTPASQSARFDVLAGIADLNDRSVLDVGCGHGDLRAHLGARYPRVTYAGVEQIQAFLDVAVARYGGEPNTTFYLGDFSTVVLPQSDYVLASGAMGYRNREPDFVLRMITRLFAVCRRGLGFNLLSHVENPAGILTAYDAGTVLTHCRGLTPHLVYRDDYLPDDFTVYMYRCAGS